MAYAWRRILVTRLSGSVVTREARERVWDVSVCEGGRERVVVLW